MNKDWIYVQNIFYFYKYIQTSVLLHNMILFVHNGYIVSSEKLLVPLKNQYK